MDIPLASLRQYELVSQLGGIERDIARSRTFRRSTDPTGRTRVEVSPELLALAEREHHLMAELRGRRRVATLAA